MSEDDAGGGARAPRTKAVPKVPSQDEVNGHNITHMPYAAWCPSCVAGRAASDQYKKVSRDGRLACADVVVQFEYGFQALRPFLVGACTVTGKLLGEIVTL